VHGQFFQTEPDQRRLLHQRVGIFLREQYQCLRLGIIILETLNRAGPRPLLDLVDFVEVQYMSPGPAAVGQPTTLHNAPIVEFLPFVCIGATQTQDTNRA
jgi:hypothetical protein